MPTKTAKQKKAFNAALLAQLPAFVDFLQNWEIPAELVADRFGITHYHHPEILEGLHEQSPEEQLLDLIDEVLFGPGEFRDQWTGLSRELNRMLKNTESKSVQREAEKLLPSVGSCGKYLARLAERYKDRVIKHAGRAGTRSWTIKAPQNIGCGGVFQPPLKALDLLRNKLRESSKQAANNNDSGDMFPNVQSEDSSAPAEAMANSLNPATSGQPGDEPGPMLQIKMVSIEGASPQDPEGTQISAA